jgi:uncharacterized repeat protein (TIGR02543 family)
MEALNLTVSLGEWRIAAKAYKEDGLAGTGSLSLTVVPGYNIAEVPMYINGGYFDIAIDSSMGNGTVAADFDAAFPGTTVTLTLIPEAGYVLKAGTLTYGSGYNPAGSGLIYTFTMPAADVTVSAAFEAVVYTVTFDTNGGSAAPEAQIVAEGSKATEPADPTKAGYIFGGWFREMEMTNQWNFATDTVTADITFYARWIPLPFKMVSLSEFGAAFPVTFPREIDDSGTATVNAAYEIGATEVTYELWYTVREWAKNKVDPYTFSNPGREGSGINDGGSPTGASQEPVTDVTWFDAVVWLNALTEWVNEKTGSNLTPVYYYDSGHTTVAKDSDDSSNFTLEGGHSCRSAYAKPGATGFRLPTSNEWELAARWRGNDTANTVSSYTDPYFTQGDSASGATADHNNATATGDVAWYTDNASGTLSVSQKGANTLGLFDMSGNVGEWCDDWQPGNSGSFRIVRGGSWNDYAIDLQLGFVNSDFPNGRLPWNGFRPARTP